MVWECPKRSRRPLGSGKGYAIIEEKFYTGMGPTHGPTHGHGYEFAFIPPEDLTGEIDQ